MLYMVVLMLVSVSQVMWLHTQIMTQEDVRTMDYSLLDHKNMLALDKEQEDHEIVTSGNTQKPLLVLHVGPLKTGSTSVQLNVIRNKEFKPFLTQDHYQEIVGFDYRHFKPLFQTCFNNEESPSQDCTLLSTLQHLYEQAFNQTQSQNFTIHTIHTSEDFSAMPRNNLTFHTMKHIFEKWNIHIIMFYRPMHHWLSSMYAQYRKYYIARPKDADQPFEQKYLIAPGEQMDFPTYFRMLQETQSIRDTIGTFRYFHEFFSFCSTAQVSSLYPQPQHRSGSDSGSGSGTIHVLPMRPKDTTSSIEREFVCHLPHATNSCNYITNKKGGYKGKQRNTSFHLPLDLDLIVVQAYHERLLSVPRHDAAVALEKQFKYANISISRDLPMSCITKEEREWIWKYMVEGREYIHKTTMISDTNTQALQIEPLDRNEFDSFQTHFCSVNASAALQLSHIRKLFDTCELHSPRFVSRMLTYENVDPKWNELGCSSLEKTSNNSFIVSR